MQPTEAQLEARRRNVRIMNAKRKLPPPATDMPDKPWSIDINVDWRKLSMGEAQQAYAQLQRAYQHAASILSERSNDHGEMFDCFVCHSRHKRPARYINNAYRHPETNILIVVECCGERCAMAFETQLIAERRARNGMNEKV